MVSRARIQFLGRVGGEVGDADVADLLLRIDHIIPPAAGAMQITLDAGDVDRLPANRVFLHLPSEPLHGQLDHGARRAGDDADRLVDADALGALAVNSG